VILVIVLALALIAILTPGGAFSTAGNDAPSWIVLPLLFVGCASGLARFLVLCAIGKGYRY
jgi:hypothetical protein